MIQADTFLLINYVIFFDFSMSIGNLVWTPGERRNKSWKSGSWGSEFDHEESNRIQGGREVKDKDLFPWAAFIFISFPCYTWKIWDPVKKEIWYEYHENKHQWVHHGCTGAWVSPKLVLTANHCLYLAKPPYHVLSDTNEDPSTSVSNDPYYRNVIKDKSKYPVACQHPIIEKFRGSFNNVAVKLYGIDYPTAHPTDKIILEEGIVHPWWMDPDARSFEVQKYRTLKTGVDLAILEMDEGYLGLYFVLPLPSIPQIFKRLHWVTDPKHKLKVGDKVVQLGTGMLSNIVINTRQTLRRTNDLEMIDQERCKRYGPWVTDYDICMSMETRTDILMVGDSGGPSFTLVSEQETPAKDAEWRIHTIHTGDYTGRTRIPEYHQVYIGDKKNEIFK